MEELLDLHVYTNNSVCGHDKVSFLCETAAAKGVRGVAFTDLCRVDAPEDYEMHRRLRHSFFDMSKAKLLFFGAVSVFAGVEFEQAFAAPAVATDVLARQRYDIVLSAVGRDRDGAPFGITRETDPAAFRAFTNRYVELLCETVERTDFDVLSRPLAPLRGCSAPLEYFESAMHEPLRLLAKKGRALEADTKDILGSERIRDLYLRLISFFRSEGGAYVTVGSESMFHDEIGSGVSLTCSALKRAGFQHAAFFDQRIPYQILL